MSLNYQLYKHRNAKLPLSILIHYNAFFSIIYAILEGQLALEKHRHYFFCNKFQRDLLLPVYFTWVLAETTRMYVGQKGTLRGRLPELAAFLLLSVFPQIFSLLYLGFLQGITVPLDKALSCIMIAFVVLEIFMAWKLLRGIVDRQTALFNVGRGISTGEKEDEITENTKDARCSASEYAREGER